MASPKPHRKIPPGLIARTPQQLESDLQQHSRRHLYGRPIQNLSSATSHFIPYRLHDVVFTALRLVIFRIDPTSATPIAHVLRDSSTDAEIFRLIGERKESEDCNPTVAVRKRQRNDHFVRCVSLREKMEEARAEHAIRLRDEYMRDVDIIYPCSRYEVEPFRSDKEKLEAVGGRPYHMYPFREKERQMALSIIVKPEALDTVFPPDRLERLGIRIKTNTHPAPGKPAKASPHGVVFPSGEYAQPVSKKPEPRQESSMDAVDRLCAGYAARGRSEIVEKIYSTPKKPSNLNGTILRGFQSRPVWSVKGEAPFTRSPGHFDDLWWVDDFTAHQANLGNWDRTTWKEIEPGQRQRHLTDVPPDESKVGVDYQTVPALCSAYVSDRKYEWYENEIAPMELQQAVELADQAERHVRRLEVGAQQFGFQFRNIEGVAKALPHDRRAQQEYHQAKQNRQLINLEVDQARSALKQLSGRARDLTLASKRSLDMEGPGIPIGEDPARSRFRLAERQKRLADSCPPQSLMVTKESPDTPITVDFIPIKARFAGLLNGVAIPRDRQIRMQLPQAHGNGTGPDSADPTPPKTPGDASVGLGRGGAEPAGEMKQADVLCVPAIVISDFEGAASF